MHKYNILSLNVPFNEMENISLNEENPFFPYYALNTMIRENHTNDMDYIFFLVNTKFSMRFIDSYDFMKNVYNKNHLYNGEFNIYIVRKGKTRAEYICNSEKFNVYFDSYMILLNANNKYISETERGNACFNVARLYTKGEYPYSYNTFDAYEYYERAVKLGCKEAYLYMAIMCREGLGTNKSINKAIEYMYVAVRHNPTDKLYFLLGSASPHLWLSYIEEEDENAKDIAYEYYKLSASLGFSTAIEKLNNL